MKNSFFHTTILFSILAATGCGNDSSDTKSQSPCTGADCHQNHSDDALAGEGEHCDDNTLCKSPLTCNDTSHTCTTTTPNNNINDDTCQMDSDCKDKDGNHRKCLDNHKCGKILSLGERCKYEDVQCETGLTCDLACVRLIPENQPCDPESDFEICEGNLSCEQGICKLLDYNRPPGAICDDDLLKCAQGATCEPITPEQPNSKICKKNVSEDEPCDTDNYILCSDGFYCKSVTLPTPRKFCTPLGEACEKTADCPEKDSFCCRSENCTEIEYGHCIPYDDETTYDATCLLTPKPGIFEAQIQCRWQPDTNDPYKASKKVEMPPLVGHFGNKYGLETVVAFWSYALFYQSNDNNHLPVIRFINPETCETIENVRTPLTGRACNFPAAADLNGDGLLEFITTNTSGNIVAFTWDSIEQKHKLMWTSNATNDKSSVSVWVTGNNGWSIPTTCPSTAATVRINLSCISTLSKSTRFKLSTMASRKSLPQYIVQPAATLSIISWPGRV